MTVLAVAATFVALSCLPASANFASSTTTQTSVSTLAVAPPGNVTLTVTYCQGVQMQLRVSWTASSAPGVNGYRISLVVNRQPYTLQASAAATTVAVNITKPNASTTVSATASATTETTYGWTAESPQTPTVSC